MCWAAARQAQATLAQQQAALHQAELNLSYTTITAPIDGTVGARTLRVGQYVQAGTQLMAVVPLQAVYVTANYKETQLTDVRPGQPVTIDVDTFPGTTVHGVVNSIAPASGAGIRAAAARQRDRQLHQDRPARPGEDHDRPARSADRPAASRHVGRADDRHKRRSGVTDHGHGSRPRGEPVVSLKTWIAVGGALIGAFMAVLNIQVTNSSLPDIEGGIGTGGVNGAWIITAYLIGEIIVIPMTDFLSRVFSLRRYLIANTVLFLLFSAACGQAHSLPEMIVLRGLQGFFGGVLIPLAFTIIVAMLPPSKRPMGLAGFAITATFAPAIGPTIGGWLTDNYGWPTIFYMNLVPGAVMLRR